MLSNALIWGVGYPGSAIVFVFLSLNSLHFHIRNNNVDSQRVESFLQSLRFPFSMIRWTYHRDELCDLLIPQSNNRGAFIFAKLIWYAYIIPFCIEILFNIWTVKNWIELIFYVFGLTLFVMGIVISWDFGKKLPYVVGDSSVE